MVGKQCWKWSKREEPEQKKRPMQEIILSFDRNDIIMKYEWWWWLKDEEYTKNSIGSQVLEWFIPQYANLNSSLIFPALDNNMSLN